MFADKVEDILFWVCKYQSKGVNIAFRGVKRSKYQLSQNSVYYGYYIIHQ